MHAAPFIFSNERKWRIRRHLSFWVAWWLFAGLIYSVGALPVNLAYGSNLVRSLLESMAYLPLHIFLAYWLNYLVIPRYLVKGRYMQAVISTMFAFAVTAMISVLIGFTLIPVVRSLFGAPSTDLFAVVKRNQLLNGFMAGLRGGITIGGLAAAIKLMKYYYVKEQRNLQLQKEKTEAQLQLLKAQVHPHFLFNTLNNIYSHTQGNSPVASQLVMGLSDMLRFMIYEGAQALVPLSKELKMIQDYINLEKIRYDDHLEVHIDIPDDTGNLHITPLLLLPLVENCFKHGTSNMLEQPWLSMDVHIEDTAMHMKLINGKPANATAKNEDYTGIGIQNVRARLELLYPGRHILQITNDADVFIVNLQIQLVRKTAVKKKEGNAFILTNHD